MRTAEATNGIWQGEAAVSIDEMSGSVTLTGDCARTARNRTTTGLRGRTVDPMRCQRGELSRRTEGTLLPEPRLPIVEGMASRPSNESRTVAVQPAALDDHLLDAQYAEFAAMFNAGVADADRRAARDNYTGRREGAPSVDD